MPGPPRLAAALVRLLVPPALRECVLGDLEERWHRRRQTVGARAATRAYWREAVRTAVAVCRVPTRPARPPNVKATKGDSVLMMMWQDIRYGARVLRKSPGYTVAVMLTLALAIGANTIIFSFTNALLIRPLPFGQTERLAWIYSLDPQRGHDRAPSSYPDYLSWRDGLTSVETLGAFTRGTTAWTGQGEPRRLITLRTTASMAAIWQLRTIAGRIYTVGEDRPGATCAVVLAHHFWQRSLAASPTAIGGPLTLDGRRCTVVGVLTPDIEIGNMAEVDVWMPMAVDATRTRRDDRVYRIVGRLRPGATVEHVSTEARAISERLQREYPATNAGWSSFAIPTREAITGPDTWITLALLGAVVLFVLLIACANITNLMLARATVRRAELAVRAALGAGRSRVIRLLLTEGLLLGLLGGAAGLALAEGGLRLIRAAAFERFFELVTIDRTVMAFAALLSIVAPLVFTLLPALHATGASAGDALKQASTRTIGGAARRSRHALVVVQVALSIMLLVIAGLVVRTMIAVNRTDLRLDPGTLLTVSMELPDPKYGPAQVARFYDDALRTIRALPGVQSAAAASTMPMLENAPRVRFVAEGRPVANGDERPWAGRVSVTADYFRAVGLPLLAGRAFEPTDSERGGAVAVIDAEAARRYWGTAARALGARVSTTPNAAPASWMRIVGVVGNIENIDLQQAPDPHLYIPMAQQPSREAALVVRSTQPASVADRVRAAIHAADPDLPLSRMRTMAQALEEDRSSGRILTAMFVAFGVIALLLACTGLYGVVAFWVGQREQEIGVRVALGAAPGQISRLVFSQVGRLVGIGVTIGIAGAAVLARLVQSELYGVTARDPVTYTVVLITMIVCALVATWWPARRAMRLDPVRALRA